MFWYEQKCNCGKDNVFRTSNKYTPIKLAKRCIECQEYMTYEIEEKDTSYLYDHSLEETLAARKVKRMRRPYEYAKRVHNEYLS
jgi:hypothetical protein